MNVKSWTMGALAVLALATATLAFDIVIRTDPSNVVSSRIVGKWKLDAQITRRLDPDRSTTTMQTVELASDPAVLTRLQAVSDRFTSDHIFMSGMIKVEGKSHPFVISDAGGNMNLVWFFPSADGTNPIGQSLSKTVIIATASDRANDILFLGGDTARQASAAFVRALP